MLMFNSTIILELLTGLLKEKFPQLKTKEVVDLVGLSVLLPLLSHSFYLKDKLYLYHNNNLLTVQENMEIKVAMVDSTIKV
jgi:hypothetical protein